MNYFFNSKLYLNLTILDMHRDDSKWSKIYNNLYVIEKRLNFDVI